MNRDIEFRGKDIYTNKWVYGSLLIKESVYYISKTGMPVGWIDGEIQTSVEWFQVFSESVGQYIGLKDSKGNKIFEGDIIRYEDKQSYDNAVGSLEDDPEDRIPHDYRIGYIKWLGDEGYPAFDIEPHINNLECNVLSYLIETEDWVLEVIGNVTDNPELLKGEKC